MYGILKAVLLFWKKLSASPKPQGFGIHPYNWCIANKDINSSQCTIVWHVDDLKTSHKEPPTTNGIIASLNTEYRQVVEMTTRREKKHNYLGMVLDFFKVDTFIFDTEEYLKKMLDDLSKNIKGTVTILTLDHLLKVQRNAPKLNQERAEFFHCAVAQILFVA